ncbi:acyl-CoA dehydrogenase family protein [Zavarzinia compransoris]|uniref:Acyl-CoA dehydrogenase n=1 Tax=Zavarzinia compransoris TaxID=1264899 RepID=A0A317E1H1_9PROT|nr:acyl-CoA dehydrogenase family protein [Zavarzinia compransoris]PWR18995.1 acyl-CoA dehydrogenase [Zavarzinia compransoris]TDP48997.1 acyl-CoA dehydrogenase [Zavarzinia compransoris]
MSELSLFDPLLHEVPSPYYTPAHREFRAMLRKWVDEHIAPFVDAWDEAGGFPRELYRKAADIGLIGMGFPEAYGGVEGTDLFHSIIATEELARPGCGGVIASLMSHSIGAPPIRDLGSDEMKARVLPGILSGEKISALAITEPSGGSDVANLRTTAVRDGDHYRVNGEKVFITSGIRADYITTAVRTGGKGFGGISLLLIETERPGITRTPLKKMGWWASDTAAIHFNDVKVPADNLIGPENAGFLGIVRNFNAERIGLAAGANAFARVALEEALAWARQRQTFGKRLADHQVIRHKLVDMAQRVNATQALLENLAWRIEQGDAPIAEICMLKNQATTTMEFCAREAMQILGGAGYMRGVKTERIYREVRVNAIGGGSEEIMRDLAARQMGL